jgi:hypothetical protein
MQRLNAKRIMRGLKQSIDRYGHLVQSDLVSRCHRARHVFYDRQIVVLLQKETQVLCIDVVLVLWLRFSATIANLVLLL